jgi:hypothetical protein
MFFYYDSSLHYFVDSGLRDFKIFFWLNDSRRFQRRCCHFLQEPPIEEDNLILESLGSFEMLGSTHQKTPCHTLQALNPQ